jgi:phosphoribosylformylglycinamidine (FGAM) synthase-like enzyme
LPDRLAIPPTLLISALGIVPDVRHCITMDLKEPGDVLVLASAPVERVGLPTAWELHRRVAAQVADGTVRAAHDVSDGGLAVAVAEMCIASGLGARVEAGFVASGEDQFADWGTSYVLEMTRRDAERSGWRILGEVTAQPVLKWNDVHGSEELTVSDMDAAWRSSSLKGGGRTS